MSIYRIPGDQSRVAGASRSGGEWLPDRLAVKKKTKGGGGRKRANFVVKESPFPVKPGNPGIDGDIPATGNDLQDIEIGVPTLKGDLQTFKHDLIFFLAQPLAANKKKSNSKHEARNLKQIQAPGGCTL